MATEPTLEQLSAYLDGELDSAPRADLEAHLKTCSTCRARLEGLRQTVSAVRALPMETPPRTFTVPDRHRQGWRWAPVGWATSGAAAAAFVIFVVFQLHTGGGGATTASSSANFGAARIAVAPLSHPALAPQDQARGYAAATALSGEQVSVTDPGNSTRSLTISTDARGYRANGVLTLRVSTKGLTAGEARTIQIFLSREAGAGGYAVRLAPPGGGSPSAGAFDASYAIQDMQLQSPPDGNYSLQVSVDLSGGTSLIAHLPVTITP